MKSNEETPAATDERRRSGRVTHQNKIHLRIEAIEMEGRAENMSGTGVLFYTDGSLPVVIEFEDEDGSSRSRKAHLVRMQRMRGKSAGWAVEFDD